MSVRLSKFVIAILLSLVLPGWAVAAQNPDAQALVPPQAGEDQTAKPPLVPTKLFAGRLAFWGAEISPDGSVMTVMQRVNDRLQMTVIETGSRKVVAGINFTRGTAVDWIEWIDSERMIINAESFVRFGTYTLRTSKMYLAYPKEGRAELLVDIDNSLNGGNLIHIAEDGQSALIAHRAKSRGWEPAVYRYELKPGGAVTKVLPSKPGVSYWIADDAGVIRVGLGWKNRRLSIFYRDGGGEKFRRIAKVKEGDTQGFFDAVQILSGSARGFVLDESEEGRVGLRLFDYEENAIVETVYEHPEWDLDDVWIDNGKPVAAFYTDDRSQVVWFDEELKSSHEALEEALGDSQAWVVSRSEDSKKMLVSAFNEADPGVLYIFDAQAGSLNEFAPYRPMLDFRLLVRPKAVSYTARDGTEIRAYLTLPKGRDPRNLPLILLPHGGPFGIRDKLTYNDEVQFLANRGYAVLQPNFRGSGGYGSAFYDLGVGQVGRGMQDDLDDAMDWAVREGIADPNRVCIVGGSYGGYAALWGVLRNPERYACAASWAGVTDWTRMLKYDHRVLTRKAGKRWSAKIEGDDEEFDLKDVSPYRLAKGLKRPVLIAHGTNDTNVPFKQYEQMIKASAKAAVPLTTLVIEGEGHGFSRAESEQKWYDALDAFLAKPNPADQLDEDGVFRPPSGPDLLDQFNSVDIQLPPVESE